jgi:putative serine protease PepD
MKSFLSAVLGALTVCVVLAVLAVAGVFDDADDDSSAAARPAASGASTTARPASDVADIYERTRPGVVDVRVTLDGGQATGSGFVIDERGTIVTNEHVVDDARTARIRFAGQDRPVTARVLGSDASSDLAVLRVDPDDVRGGLDPLTLGRSRDLRVGETAIALGSPFGLDGTLTTGVVSALDRDIESPNGFTIDGVVQTDAAINPGNSGGPLLDAQGRVIGVNAQRAGGTGSSLGFAVGVDTVREVAPRLARGEEIERPYLGVSTGERANGNGARVAQVVAGGPAADAGLRAGDIITRVGRTTVAEPDDVAAAIASNQPGDTIQITFTRDGDQRTERVRLGTRPEEISTR